MGGAVTGTSAWIYVPGKGRFWFSLSPKPRYEKAGSIQGDTLQFEWGGTKYRLECEAPIVTGGGEWVLYVKAEEMYRPAGEEGRAFHMGSND